MTEQLVPFPKPPPAERTMHPDCEKMHAQGYCVCLMVECIWCDPPRPHPTNKPCRSQCIRPITTHTPDGSAT